MKLAPLLIILTFFGGCYSFTGSSVPTHLKTIAIPLFDDQSGGGEPGLREKLTNKLIDKFRQDNSLEIADRTNADCLLEGTILSMIDQPQVVSAGETVSKRRLTISVKVIYQDMKLKKKVWEKQFSGWSDYQLGSDITQRDSSISAANDKLSDDILLNTVSGW